ncbi:hypothetical protein Bca52824_048179 [Brassica carinata]|uniref:Uncharacterized protein n=1 Tax=Brassica carinata TaxID=52824 RepID=A0A8X7RHY0_BRACI|nr:hypothetical protein Bca52824_048179 [Brassica carinata]
MSLSRKTRRTSLCRVNGDNSLNGSFIIDYAHIEQWIDFASLEIDANMLRWFTPRMGYVAFSAPAEEAAISGLKRGLDALNTHLASDTYLVGQSITLTDITEAVPRILSKEAAQPTKPKEETKKAAPPAEEPKLAKEEKATKLDEEVEAPKPKAKYPIDFLPPSPMVLDEWKRLYSNTKSNNREVVIKVYELVIIFFLLTFTLVLNTYKGNKEAYKALIVAEYADVMIEEASNFQMGVTNKSPEFLKLNPIREAHIEQWIDFSSLEINANMLR